MKFNGATFNKAQQDQLKKKVGAELNELSSRMLNYTGDWVTGNEYHENDVVTWEKDGHLYEVIKAHTSSETLNPSNTEYYKAMTASKAKKATYNLFNVSKVNDLKKLVLNAANNGILSFAAINWDNKVEYSPLLISDNGATMHSYLSNISSNKSTLTEYFLSSYASNSVIMFKRTTNLATGETSYTEIPTGSLYAIAIIGY